MVLEQMEMEWSLHLKEAKLSAAEVIAACDVQKLAEFVLDTEDGEDQIKVETDFWTEGRLTELKQRAASEQRRLDDADGMNLDGLKESLARSEQMRPLVELLAEQAKEALIASQLRNNIGQTIEDSLLDAGWEVTDATYEGEDFREAMHVKLQNMAGDELVTVIRPERTPERTIRNHLNISFFDRSTNDETSRLQRLGNIMELLNEDGLECGAPACAPGTENQPSTDTSRLDFETVRTQKTRR